jgi:hypothetical protein
MRTLAAFALALAVPHVAAADTVTGDKSERLTYALRYAGARASAQKAVRTFVLDTVACVKTVDAGGNVADYACTVASTPVKDATAYLLYTALLDLGFVQTPVGDTKIKLSAQAIACTLDASKTLDQRYACTGDDLVATPDNTKTVIHPIKIQKQ